KDAAIMDIIETIGAELEIDMFTATPLDNAGTATFKAKSVYFDQLLTKLFEVQAETGSMPNANNNQNGNMPRQTGADNNRFTFKKEDGIYYFGTEKQLSVRQVEIIPLQYRSIELQADPSGGGNMFNRVGNSVGNSAGSSSPYDNYNRQFNSGNNSSGNFQNQNNFSGNRSYSGGSESKSSLLDLVPTEISNNLEIVPDYELNSFYVVGPGADILRFKNFVASLDKPVPVILIEVMIVEVSRTTKVETGVEWGLGEEPVQTVGGIFPQTNLTLGATTINKIIGGIDDF